MTVYEDLTNRITLIRETIKNLLIRQKKQMAIIWMKKVEDLEDERDFMSAECAGQIKNVR